MSLTEKRKSLPIRQSKPKDDFERDIVELAKRRPGWTAVRCECKWCGHVNITVLLVDDFVEFCPRCGLDGNAAHGSEADAKRYLGATK